MFFSSLEYYFGYVWHDCVLPVLYDYLPEQERPIFYPGT